ncbi:MAG TPA: RagB/SusD family nutrient uptake outer membrane protein [Gemmatimonadaceae bacterium]|jgi:hypothetical protein
MIHKLSYRALRGVVLAGAVALGSALTACNLDVSTPDVVPPDATAGAAALPTLLAGASGDFAVAYGGYNNGDNSDAIIQTSGLFTDEFIAADFFSTHVTIDSRDANPTNDIISRVMRNIQRSIVSANNTAARYAQFAATDPGFARVLNFAGFDYVFLAENFCSGVPVGSHIDASGAYVFGTPESTTELLNAAIVKFDSAAAVAGGDDLMRYTAMVGKGRALLDLDQPAQAAAAVAGVPTTFRFTTEHDPANDRTKSGMYELMWVDTRLTTSDREGQNGLPFVSGNDPRTATQDLDISAFDGETEILAPVKYGSWSAPEVIADGTEARLIEAEAALRAGNYGGANGTLELLNALRTDAGLPALSAATGATAQQDQLFSERAFWLFGTAHRLGDLRRLVRQPFYGRNAESVFPTGDYFKGDKYSTDVNLPVPQEEESNPNFKRSACDQSKA